MAGSSIHLSLLAKGIGQLSKNGHERLDVYLEPEDYYNLQSQYQKHQLNTLRQKAIDSHAHEQFESTHPSVPLHKTFLTRKGALLLFSEDLAKTALEEERKREGKDYKDQYLTKLGDKTTAIDSVEGNADILRTCNDLSWAILNYGTKPDYRRRGDELYLRFVHEVKGNARGRSIRPGFSPKRYISAWSKYWDDGMLQKLRKEGMVSDKTLFRQNPLLPHLYKFASYNLSSIPPPYRVTRNMLLPPGNVPSYEFYRTKGPPQTISLALREAPPPPPSQLDEPMVDPGSLGTIQAVKYHESGEIQEVTYSELKPQEKKEILAELLIAAHEHQQHIRDTLELVMTTNRNRERDSDKEPRSSASSELMADMQRAIMSLVESPVRQQMRERQKILQEQEEKLQKEQKERELKEEQKRKRRQEKKTKKVAEEKARDESLNIQKKERKTKQIEHEETRIADEEARFDDKKMKEERKKRRKEEREARQKRRQERAIQKEKEKAAEVFPKLEAARQLHANEEIADEAETEIEQSQKKHRRPHDENEIVEKRKQKKERRSRRLENEAEKLKRMAAEAEGVESDERPRVYIRTNQRPSADPPLLQRDEPRKQVFAVVSPERVTEIQQLSSSEHRQLHRRDAGISVQMSVNTPAVDARSLAKSQSRDDAVEYEEFIVVERQSSRRRSVVSLGDDVKARSHFKKPSNVSRGSSAARSVASSQSSGPKQVLFELPDDGSSSHKQTGSFYGGRMPITSTLFKQTLSDKVSLSASRDSEKTNLKPQTEQHSVGGMQSSKSGEISEKPVPSIGIEPATPLNPNQKTVSPMPQIVLHSHNAPLTQYLSPTSSISGTYRSPKGGAGGSEHDSQRSQKRRSSNESDDGTGSYKKLPSKKSDSDDDDFDPSDSSSQSSINVTEKSLKRETASKSSQTTSTSSKRKSKKASVTLSNSLSTNSKSWMNRNKTEPPVYTGLKGHKGPGSQSSSSMFKSSTTKKSRSTRGSLPSAMKRGDYGVKASVRMPDGEYVSVGRSLNRSEDLTDAEPGRSDDDATYPSESTGVDGSMKSQAKTSLKSSTKTDEESAKRGSRRVSFQDVSKSSETDEDQNATSVDASDYDVTEEETEEEGGDQWPVIKEEVASSTHSRPISSRSEKLTAHAQKVAAMVINKQRPDSRLDDDAKEAASLWNQALEESEESTEEEEEEEWGVIKKPASSVVSSTKSSRKTISVKQSSENDGERKRKPEKFNAEKPKLKEKQSSLPDTQRSGVSSVSSVQEAFVNEIQKRASDLGIEPSELHFQADVVNRLEKSAIAPQDVEVVHDTQSGRHIVRSRKSSAAASSVLTPSTVGKDPPSTAASGPVAKQKLVVDLNLEKRTSATHSRTSSRTSTSQSPRSSVSPRRSSIPVDKHEVKLDFDVTTYESKLGDPKVEEPTIQSGRPQVEPERIKTVESEAIKHDPVSKIKATDEESAPGPIKSSQSGAKKPTAPTKGPLRKGQTAEKTNVTSSTAESSITAQDQKAQKPAKIAEKTIKKKGSKAKAKPESVVSDKSKEVNLRDSPEKRLSKTPETPFRAGRAKEAKRDEYMSSAISPEELGKQESIASISKSKKGSRKTKKKEPLTQIEKDTPKPEEVALPKHKKEPTPEPSTPAVSPTKKSETKDDNEDDEDDEDDYPEYVTPVSPEDDYEFVRREDTPVSEEEPEPQPPISPAKTPAKQEDAKSQASGVTEATELSSQAAAQAAEDEAKREAKLAAKQEREKKRAAAAEKRRLEVERKRKEKEEQIKREKEEQERQEKMREDLEAERRRREEAHRMKKEEAEREKQREKEAEELRQKRLLQQQERERKQQEEFKRKMEEMQRKKREEDERKREEARRLKEEEEARRKEEEELMAQMEESERELYAQKKREEEEARKKLEEENRIRLEEERKIAMEQARIQAIVQAKQAAALEEKLRFVREFFNEANELEQTQKVNRSFIFSYFELMRMLGLDVPLD